jgi:NAD(P)-dependent dehydrogenase (short-subunit alcohol dehydrogenase family)
VKDLGGRVAVVTGAASGIGKAMATSFADAGMRVMLADIDDAALESARAELAAAGHDVRAVRTDVSRADDIEALRDTAFEAFGAVHVLCNNAGVDSGGPFASIPQSTWEWVLAVDLWSVIHGCRIFLPQMVEQGVGHIVNTSSIAAYTGMPLSAAPYVAAKSAVLGISKNLRDELAATAPGVGISVLIPGPVRTNMPTSERTRPPDVEAPPESELRAGVLAFIDDLLAREGMDPALVGEMVVRAVTQERFFVLTHPDEVYAPIKADLEQMERENLS